jgi:peptidyl-prolyl cis-trans isomerase SurA
MLRRASLIALMAVLISPAEIIDRIAVKVGKRVITESALLLEIRLTAFLNGESADFSAANKRKAADRMVDQTLIRNEMDLSQYPMPGASETVPVLEQVKREHFPTESEYRAALARYGISEAEVQALLLRQIYTLRFIDTRFRPGVQTTEPEIREFYEKRFVPEWHNKSKGPVPSFDEAKTQVEQALIADRVDQLVETWLKEARARTHIEFMEKAFE